MNVEKSAGGDRCTASAEAPVWWSRWVDQLEREVTTAIVESMFPRRKGSGAFQARITGFVRSQIEAIAAAGRPGATRRPADEESAKAFGRWLAEQQLPTGAVQDIYWKGMRRTLEIWAGAGWKGLTPPESDTGGVSGEVVTRVIRTAMGLAERGASVAVAAHGEAVAALRGGGDLRRRDLALEIVKGKHEAGTFALEAALGYRLSATHLAVLLDASSRSTAERVLRDAQTAVGARDRLLVPLAAPQWAGWLGFARDVDAEALAALRGVLGRADMNTAVGGPRYGIQGFRRAHEEAVRIEGMRSVLAIAADSCLCFSELALEVVLLSDVPAASAFAADELGELAVQTQRAARIRNTLFAWLTSGSQTLAASRLGVHENTVRLRLATAAHTLGPDFLERRTELLTALRLCRALGADRLQADAVPVRMASGRER